VHVGAKPAVKLEKTFDSQGGQQEGYGQPHRINREQHNALEDGVLGGGESEDDGENRADTGRPAKSEGETDDEGAACGAAAFQVVEALVGVEGVYAKQTGQVQDKQNDDDAGDLRQGGFVAREQLSYLGRNRAQRDKDDAEAKDERERVQHSLAQQARLLRLQFFDPRTRDKRYIAGYEGKHARREKRNQAGHKGSNWKRKTCHRVIFYPPEGLAPSTKWFLR